MKIVAYLRVSTDRQAEEGLGLDVQEQAIRRWAKEQGHRVVVWARDAGVSGSNGLDGRVGLVEALDEISKHRASGLVVYRLDRLARDVILQEQLLAEVWRLGGTPFSTSPSEDAFLTDDPNDPSRRLIRVVLGAVAEYDRSMIALRLRAGRRRKAELGGFAYGAPSYGHRSERGVLVAQPDEQRAVERALELRREGASLRAIGDALSAEGYKPRRSDRWHPNGVRRILLAAGA